MSAKVTKRNSSAVARTNKRVAGLKCQAESQRDSGSKPKVARHELPWVSVSWVNNPNGVVAGRRNRGATPLGLKTFTATTQGSSCLATLGWRTQSHWDCRSRKDCCSEHDEAVARYSMGNVTNKILAAQYKLAVPDPRVLEKEIVKTRRMLELRAKLGYKFAAAKSKP